MSKLVVLFEDEDLIIIDKPSGLHSSKLPGGGGDSIADLLLKRSAKQSAVSKKPEDAGLINRLDFETSGVLLAAKTREAWEKMQSLSNSGSIKKEYLALLEGKCPQNMSVKGYIGSRSRGAKKATLYKSKRPRSLWSSSEFFLVRYDKARSSSLVRVSISEGRRHQIRVHASSSGHPLIGDSLYNAKSSLRDVIKYSGELPPFFLHAERVIFPHPFSAKKITVSSQAPGWI